MKSKNARRESCKRRMDFDDDLETSHTDSSKKRKFSDSDHDFESKKSKDDLSSPLRNPRVLRSSGLLTEKTTPERRTCNKEKENESANKNKRLSKRHSARVSDQVLKNVKLNNFNKSSALLSDSDESNREEDVYLLSTPKLKSRKLSRNSTSKSVDYSNKLSESGLGTPSTKSVPATPTTPLEKARSSLHVSCVPKSLPCREREFKNIFSFLENKLLDGIGGCMYISGVPGTGKTATVTQVIRKLKSMASEEQVPDFKFIEINGMRLADPRQAYILLWQGLTDKKEKISAEQAQRKLDAWFSKPDTKDLKMPTLLLVDELDLICTKKQDVVYNLLDWPTKSPSRLIVLTIANTMDMPERLFKGRVTSRLGLTRLTFLPYTYKQLEEIVMTRLSGLNAFTLDAVRLVTRKVAAVSGDARRSLDICRRATELPAPDETVKISHIEQAISEMTNSNSVKIIRSCSQLEKLFLRAVSEVSIRTGVEEVDLRDVIEHFLALCTLEGFSRLPVSHILHISNRLKCFRLLFTSHSQNGILQRLTLNVSQDDIHYGIKCDS